MRMTYPATMVKPSDIVGDSIYIETRKFRRHPPKSYEHCEKEFYVIHTQDNTTVTINTPTTNDCMFVEEKDGEVKVNKPYYVQTQQGVQINGKKFIIESLDKNISKLNKYDIVNLTATHKAQTLTTKAYTRCSMYQEHAAIIRSADYGTLVAIKEKNKIASGDIIIPDE